MKVCSKCQQEKDVSAFGKMSQSSDGLRPNCKECRKAESLAWYERNQEAIKARSKKWREDNPDRYKEQLAKWGAENRDYKREQDRNWYRQNAEHAKAVRRQYAKDNSQNWRNQRARRRAQVGATVNKITKAEWLGLIEQYEKRCAYCEQPTEKPTMDHVVPLIKGGSHTVDNIVPACGPCNREKSDRSVVEFMATRQRRIQKE